MAKKSGDTSTKTSKSDKGKTPAILSYLTWIGWVVALILNQDKKDEFAKFHLRQSLLIYLAAIVGSFVFWIPLIGWLLALSLFVLWVMGLVSAVNGEKKEVPVLGDKAQEWFKGL